jgi:cysteinyl-tRNA synthetase
MDAMGNIRPDISCRATEHIPAQLEMVKKLEQKGFAYVIAGDGVYFDTSKFPDYPNLSRMKMDELEAGARIEVVAGKRHPTDFALWKFERPGENRAMVPAGLVVVVVCWGTKAFLVGFENKNNNQCSKQLLPITRRLQL